MLFEELMKDEYNAGKAEGMELGKAEGKELGKTEALTEAKNNIITIIAELSPISENLKNRILSIDKFGDVMQLTVKAAKAESLRAFEDELAKMGY